MAEDGELFVHLVGGSSDEEDEEDVQGNHEEAHEELEEVEDTFKARSEAEGTSAGAESSEARNKAPDAPEEQGASAGRLRGGTEGSGREPLEAREESPGRRPSKRRRKWEDGPYVKVTYGNLTRPALQRLQDLLRSWSASEDAVLQARRGDLSLRLGSGGGELLSGTSVFLPGPAASEEARPNGDASETASWWIELPHEEESPAPSSSAAPAQNKTLKGLVKQLAVSTDVPAYDRGASTALTGGPSLAKVTTPLERAGEEGTLLSSVTSSSRAGELSNDRCFNCSSYTHSLRQCPKPRDTAAISAARAEYSANRNSTDSNSGAPRRYHGLSRADFILLKYGEPNPGVLSARLRDALGIGELDPPPWLDRMRVFGYPPGYLKRKNRASEEEEDAANVLPMFGASGEEVAGDTQQSGRGEENGIGEESNGEGPSGRATKIGRVMGMFAATVGARQAAAGAVEWGEVAEEGEAEPAKEWGSSPAEAAGTNRVATGSAAVTEGLTVREGINGGAVLATDGEMGALEDGEIEEVDKGDTRGGDTKREREEKEESLRGRSDDSLQGAEEAFEEYEQTVKFPGLNAPIPEGASPRAWGISEADMGTRGRTQRSFSDTPWGVPQRQNSSNQSGLLGVWPGLSNYLPMQLWSYQYHANLLASPTLSPQMLTRRYEFNSSRRERSPIQYGSPSREQEDMDMSD